MLILYLQGVLFPCVVYTVQLDMVKHSGCLKLFEIFEQVFATFRKDVVLVVLTLL
jgi:hypothetical protein